jgi:hypothetical protein
MFGSRLSLKSIGFLLLALSLSGATSAHDSLRSIDGGDEIKMASGGPHGDRRLKFNLWYSIMCK